jgi:hypothetical protein
MSEVVTTMDSAGWLTNPAQKADRLMAYFLVNNHSQSNLFLGQVRSLPYIIQSNPNDMPSVQTQVSNALNTVFGAAFDQVQVSVAMTGGAKSLGGSASIYDISIQVDCTQDGVTQSLGRLINIVDSKIAKVSGLTG